MKNRSTTMADYAKFGHDKLGPFLMGYTQWLRTEVKNRGINKIFFFSRDGYLMQKAYNELDQYNPLNIETCYCYFSRNSLRKSLLWACKSYEESLQYLSVERFSKISEIATYYGLCEADIADILKQHNAQWTQDLLYAKLKESQLVRQIYTQNRERIVSNSLEQYNLITAYLQQIGMSRKCAIVDVGWHGSMQYYLEQIIDLKGIDASIDGFYIGINPTVPIAGRANGYMFDNAESKMRKRLLCFLGVMEKLLQSTEGSTKGYRQEPSGVVVPTLEPYEYSDDKEATDRIEALQSGAIEYLNNCGRSGLAATAKSYAPLLQFGMYPTAKDVDLFRFFYNTDGSKVYFVPQKSIWHYSLSEFVHALSNSTWKPGFMKAAFRLPLPYYWVYNYMRR